MATRVKTHKRRKKGGGTVTVKGSSRKTGRRRMKSAMEISKDKKARVRLQKGKLLR